MASSASPVKLFADQHIEMLDNDPGTASAKIVSADGSTYQMRDIRDYLGFAAIVMPTVASSQCTLLEIVASSDSLGASNVTVVRSSGAVVADAPLVDYVTLECTQEQVKEVDTGNVGLRYVGARITSANAGDEHAVVYVRFGAKSPSGVLTANNIS